MEIYAATRVCSSLTLNLVISNCWKLLVNIHFCCALSYTGSGKSGLSTYGSSNDWRLPQKLQIVKPIEGSLTLHQWSRLATPHLGGLLEEREGVAIKVITLLSFVMYKLEYFLLWEENVTRFNPWLLIFIINSLFCNLEASLCSMKTAVLQNEFYLRGTLYLITTEWNENAHVTLLLLDIKIFTIIMTICTSIFAYIS